MSDKPIINVKRFSRAKKEVLEPINENVESIQVEKPLIEKKVRKPRVPKQIPVVEESIIVEEEQEIPTPIPVEEDIITFNELDATFLEDLNNINFKFDDDEATATIKNENKNIIQTEKQQLQLQKQRIATEKENYKFNLLKEKEEAKLLKNTKSTKTDDDDNIYSSNPTEILGKDKHLLLNKVKQYKCLFPDELKTFKIKINPTVAELKSYIDEIDVIINSKNVDNFLTESILGTLKIIEGTTVNFKHYNLSGLSDMLKNNKQFHNLCKQLYLKYNTFNNIPPEYQMIMLVSTTAFICKTKNSKKNEINKYLDEEINISI